MGFHAQDIAGQGGTRILTGGGALNGPLGLTLAPDGDLVAVNGNAIEITPGGAAGGDRATRPARSR